MVDLALLQSVSYIAGALGVCIAAIYYVINIVNTNRTRQVQVFMQVFTQFNNKQFWEDYFAFMEAEWTTIEEYHEKFGKDTIDLSLN